MNRELRNKIVGLCMTDLETLVATNPIGAKVIQRFNKKVITGVNKFDYDSSYDLGEEIDFDDSGQTCNACVTFVCRCSE